RGLALLPGVGDPAAGRLVGKHDQCWARLPATGALDRLRPRGGPLRDRRRFELRGRCRARCAGPSPARVTFPPTIWSDARVTCSADRPELPAGTLPTDHLERLARDHAADHLEQPARPLTGDLTW